ncbi:hypothetical protein LINGRAHAP2_LOCUS34621, partial [Linum grandiflorum]
MLLSYLSIERIVGNGCWLDLKVTRLRVQIFRKLPLPSKREDHRNLCHLSSIPMSRSHRKLPPVLCRLSQSLPPTHLSLTFRFVKSCRKWILKIVSVLATLLFNLTTNRRRK